MEFACVWDANMRRKTAEEKISVTSQPFLKTVSWTLVS